MKNSLLLLLLLFVSGGVVEAAKPKATPVPIATPNPDEVPKKFKQGPLALTAPSAWIRQPSTGSISLTPPDGAGLVTAVLAAKQRGASLEEFAAFRFLSIPPFFTQVGVEKRSTADGIERIVREYRGIRPGEKKMTSYYVSCIRVSGAFVSIEIMAAPSEYQKNRKDYDAVVDSVEYGP